MSDLEKQLRLQLNSLLVSGAVKESDGEDWPYSTCEAEHILDALIPAFLALVEAERKELQDILRWTLKFLPETWPTNYSDTLTSAIEQSKMYTDNLKLAHALADRDTEGK